MAATPSRRFRPRSPRRSVAPGPVWRVRPADRRRPGRIGRSRHGRSRSRVRPGRRDLRRPLRQQRLVARVAAVAHEAHVGERGDHESGDGPGVARDLPWRDGRVDRRWPNDGTAGLRNARLCPRGGDRAVRLRPPSCRDGRRNGRGGRRAGRDRRFPATDRGRFPGCLRRRSQTPVYRVRTGDDPRPLGDRRTRP